MTEQARFKSFLTNLEYLPNFIVHSMKSIDTNKKIAIITQPLKNNYGGLLQNYALQKVLKQLNQAPITIDYLNDKKPSLLLFIGSWIKTILVFIFTGKNRGFAKYKLLDPRQKWSEDFITTEIDKTRIFSKYKKSIIKKNNIKAFIVGSDQVWRPRYNDRLKDMFLDFCKRNKNLKRIAYAASFGTDDWEYTSKQASICSSLVKLFNSISVREESGVQLCQEKLNVKAAWVLDPTLLLSKEDYNAICKNIPQSSEKIMVIYILDLSEPIKNMCKTKAKELGLKPIFFEAGSKAIFTVPEWLAMFRDASYVVTDSFHGTVFSIIFGKKFKCIYNKNRGAARFDSLLKIYNSGKLDEMREFSWNWLKNALEM